MKKSTGLNLLLLADDGKVFRCHFTGRRVKLLVFCLVALCAVGAASGYAAHYYWKRYNETKLERNELAEKLAQLTQSLPGPGQRSSLDLTRRRSSMTGVAAIAAEASSTELSESGEKQTEGVPTEKILPEAEGFSDFSALPEAASSFSPPQEEAAPAAAEVLPSAALPAEAAESSEIKRVEDHPVLVDKVQFRFLGENSLRLAYELVNRERDREKARERFLELKGQIDVFLEDEDGQRHDITPKGGVLRFSFKWRKQTEQTLALPKELDSARVRTLLLVVSGLAGAPKITYSFPVL